jgi:hypothetical protein
MDLTCATWRKSSYSGNNGGDCVEIAAVTGHNAGHRHLIVVRDSKDPHGPVLLFTPGGWQDFTRQAKVRRDNLV